jgi:nanoRNase/pAp phosphatase (c-di-AMP/oligoRNAs hydrolase)
MLSRLVLGCGSLGRRLALSLRDRAGPLLVLTPDTHRVETLRDENVPAKRADVTSVDAVRALVPTADSIVVGGDDAAENLAAARAAREVFPEAFLLVGTGMNPTPDQRAAMGEVADSLVDASTEMASAITERVGDAGLRSRRLRRVIRGIDGTLAVVAHDNPDPDAIASAMALSRIAQSAGTDAELIYYGDISHQQNRALVNLLEFELTKLDPDADLSRFDGFALVDHSRPGVNDQLPPETPIDIVVDHHPPRAPVEARFVDLRSHVGATSTLLTGYLRQLNIEPSSELATGLLFGIQTDTREFSREVTPEDFEAAAYLLPYADTATLERIEDPSISRETYEIIADAIRARQVSDDVLTTFVGEMGDRDALAQASDRLLTLEDINTTLVYGYHDGIVYASARARGTDRDLGEVLREAYGQIGSAGGHADMAGAQIPVGALAAETEGDEREEAIHDVMTDRFFEALGIEPDRAAAAVYGGDDFLGTDDVLRYTALPLGEGSEAARAEEADEDTEE